MNPSASVTFTSAARRAAMPALLIVTSALLLPVPFARADDPALAGRSPLVDTVDGGKGRINYGAGVVKATGYGTAPGTASSPAQAKLMALGAARADALRTLAMTVGAVQVTATTQVKNYQMDSDTVETRVSALLQSPQVLSEDVQPDGTAVVVVSLPLYGPSSVASAVLPQVLSANAAAAPDTAAAADAALAAAPTAVVVPAASPVPAAATDGWKGPDEPAVPVVAAPQVASLAPLAAATLPAGPTPAFDGGPFTSLVVDCRGLGIEAIMSPKLVDTSGREIYGTVRVKPEYAIETGIVGYPRSMAEALRTARCGAHPLIIKALRAADVHRFDPCIARADGDRILAANARDRFLESTRVIFLVDPLK